ncbi:MAG: hypothetical protein HC769_28620 [Cyanobacteria bacterium CRU_2_1]|nr:hypothetical protein [Cyanobacteria bacterium RU_5_0]NJR62421.1 hypothetical protein [Cyanobacteria bacterium CRU_2_1]
MSPQPIQTKLLAVCLFVVSACGTFALFGCVPIVARMVSPKPPEYSLGQFQAFSQQTETPASPVR